jgi:YD repeat-containing protein
VDWDGARYAMEHTPAGHPAVLHLPAEPVQVRFELDRAGRIVAETDPLGRNGLQTRHGDFIGPAVTP